MPQLDILAFFSIVFYIYTFFFMLLTYITFVFFPKVLSNIKLNSLLRNKNV